MKLLQFLKAQAKKKKKFKVKNKHTPEENVMVIQVSHGLPCR